MNPRRLIPYVIILLILVGVYTGLRWRQARQETREQEVKKIFQVQEGQIGALALVRGGDTIRLVKKEQIWEIETPLKTRADQATVAAMLGALAKLQRERDLGAQKDLKAFGLDKPALVVEFSVQGKSHRLVIGGQIPGGQGYYALKDQAPDLLLISTISKDSLDRSLLDLRDKTLLAFDPAEVKGVKIQSGKIRMDLEKTGPQAWRWVRRVNFKVRPDRVEALLRQLHGARVKEFLVPAPKNLRYLGLAPPRTQLILVSAKGQETLLLGGPKDGSVYARKGAGGPVVLVDQSLAAAIAQTIPSLEDRRLWGGSALEARRLVWGPPGKSWTANKDQDFWNLKGPQGEELKQPAARLELALWRLQKLEYRSLSKRPGPPPKEIYVLEVSGEGGKPLFRLEGWSKKGDQVEVKAQQGGKTVTALVPAKDFAEIQDDLARLTAPPKPK